MTIIYQYRVATASLGGFIKLLKTWRGSVYKLLYKEILIFCLLYTAISLTYRLGLSPSHKLRMEQLVIHCNSYTSIFPVSFVLGFYVTIIVQRWWQQFSNVPWPDRSIFIMCTYLAGEEERSKIMRRSVARYLMFGLILIMRSVSVAVMKRFPTIDTIVEAGFISKKEAEMYEAVQCRYLKFWVPIMWANNIIALARREGRIETEFGLRMVLEQLADFRDKCSLCFVYDWITIPLVYTQVVTLAVYSFFAACLVGRQYLDPRKSYPGYEYDAYIPVFTLLQFLFYMGWLKVAEQMINPFGEDDDDYDINWLLDRHMAVAFALVDQCCGRHPPLEKDQFYEETVMPEMPYTEASASSKRPNFLGSTFNINHISSEDPKAALLPVDTEGLRRRSHGSFAGSVHSLFPFRPHNRLLSGSRDTIDSGEQAGRLTSFTNKGGYLQVPGQFVANDKSRSISLDMSNDESVRLNLQIPAGRERSYSDRETSSSELDGRVRKKSFPPGLYYFMNRDNHLDHPSPKPSRFTVEPVPEDQETSDNEDGGGTGNGGAVMGSRSRGSWGQSQGCVLSMLQGATSGGKAVSRAPLLSAIEEGNTVTSVRQLLPRCDSDDTASLMSASILSLDDVIVDDLKDPVAGLLEDISEDQRELDFIDDDIEVTTTTTTKGNNNTSTTLITNNRLTSPVTEQHLASTTSNTHHHHPQTTSYANPSQPSGMAAKAKEEAEEKHDLHLQQRSEDVWSSVLPSSASTKNPQFLIHSTGVSKNDDSSAFSVMPPSPFAIPEYASSGQESLPASWTVLPSASTSMSSSRVNSVLPSRFPRRPSRGALVIPDPELLLSSAGETATTSPSLSDLSVPECMAPQQANSLATSVSSNMSRNSSSNRSSCNESNRSSCNNNSNNNDNYSKSGINIPSAATNNGAPYFSSAFLVPLISVTSEPDGEEAGDTPVTV